MLGGTAAREIEHGRRWRGSGKGLVVTHIGPEARRDRLAAGEQRHGGVIPVQALHRQDMRLDERVERREHRRRGTDPIGQGGNTQSTPSRA
jgi:hypothetical protein